MGFWQALKRFFGGGEEAAGGGAAAQARTGGAAQAAAKPSLPERFCLACHKMTAGNLSPKQGAAHPAMDFTCSACGGKTQVLQ